MFTVFMVLLTKPGSDATVRLASLVVQFTALGGLSRPWWWWRFPLPPYPSKLIEAESDRMFPDVLI